MEDYFNVTSDEYLPLRDVVFKTLRQAILMGELAPGQRLMEIQLANQLGVSRTPIREAMRKLELEGLVVMVPRKGAQVAKINQKGLNDVLEVRSSLEQLAVELACDRITNSELNALHEALLKFNKAVEHKDLSEIAETDVVFHDIIYTSTKNDRLIVILNNLREQLYRYRIEYLKDYESHPSLIAEHEAIYDALCTHNIASAKKNITSHIYNQAMTVSRIIDEEEAKASAKK
ncbi:MAG: GntR family transcriptional regulator [bacterium]|nr:GntR family transcriptional regulator [bacterium]